jgi:hypothetical protein
MSMNLFRLFPRFLNKVKTPAERWLSKVDRWRLILSEIFSKFLNGPILGEKIDENIGYQLEKQNLMLPVPS